MILFSNNKNADFEAINSSTLLFCDIWREIELQMLVNKMSIISQINKKEFSGNPLGRDQGIDDLKIDFNKRPIEHQI